MAYKSCRGLTSLAVCAVCALALVSAAGCGGGGSSATLPLGISNDISAPAQKSPAAAFRLAAIPRLHHDYQRLISQVIESQAEMDRFLDLRTDGFSLNQVSGPDGPDGPYNQPFKWTWRDNAAFVEAIREANIDFDKEALVLLPHTVPGGGIDVSLDTPQLQGEALVSTIRVAEPMGGSGAFQTFAFAIVVSKAAVKEVRVSQVNADGNALQPPILPTIGGGNSVFKQTAFRSITAIRGSGLPSPADVIDSQVISSRAQLEQVIAAAQKQVPGSDPADPRYTRLLGAEVDFDREALVLLKHISFVHSDSWLSPPQIQRRTFVSTLRTIFHGDGAPGVPIPNLYVFAVARDSIDEVRVTVQRRGGEPDTIRLTVPD